MSETAPRWWTDVARRFAHMPRAIGALAAMTLLVLACGVGPLLPALDGHALASALEAGRHSLALAFAVGATALLLGLASGAAAGYAAQGARGAAARATLAGLLPLGLGMAALALTARLDVVLVLAAAGSLGWLQAAYVGRREAHALNARPFVDAARLASVAPPIIVWRHLVPNLLGAVAVAALFAVPQALLVEALLGLVGVGLAEPPGWGALLLDATARWPASPSPLLAPAALLVIAVASGHQLADALRRALRP